MKPLILFFIVLISFSSTYSADLYLFQSTNNLDKAFVIPRDIKKRTLIVSISADCADCNAFLRNFLIDFASKDNGSTELLVTFDGALWRRAVEVFRKASWLPPSSASFTYHDPNGRFRKEIASDQGVYLILYGSNGSQERRERLRRKTTYLSFFNKGAK